MLPETLQKLLLWSRRFQFLEVKEKSFGQCSIEKSIKLIFKKNNNRMILLGTRNADMTTIL